MHSNKSSLTQPLLANDEKNNNTVNVFLVDHDGCNDVISLLLKMLKNHHADKQSDKDVFNQFCQEFKKLFLIYRKSERKQADLEKLMSGIKEKCFVKNEFFDKKLVAIEKLSLKNRNRFRSSRNTLFSSTDSKTSDRAGSQVRALNLKLVSNADALLPILLENLISLMNEILDHHDSRTAVWMLGSFSNRQTAFIDDSCAKQNGNGLRNETLSRLGALLGFNNNDILNDTLESIINSTKDLTNKGLPTFYDDILFNQDLGQNKYPIVIHLLHRIRNCFHGPVVINAYCFDDKREIIASTAKSLSKFRHLIPDGSQVKFIEFVSLKSNSLTAWPEDPISGSCHISCETSNLDKWMRQSIKLQSGLAYQPPEQTLSDEIQKTEEAEEPTTHNKGQRCFKRCMIL